MSAAEDNEAAFDENKNWLEELVGEGRKFKDNNELAKSKAKSDSYIKVLETRLDFFRDDNLKLREENVTGQKLQDQIEELRTLQQQLLTSREQPPISNEEKEQPILKPEDLDNLVASKFQQMTQAERETNNINEVEGKLKERFGDKYPNVLKEKAKSLGLSDTDVNQMARLNPTLFYKTFDVNEQRQQETFQTPPTSLVRNDNFAPKGKQERTMSYYMELRKKDPRAWHQKEIAVQMDKDAQRLGDAFYDV